MVGFVPPESLKQRTFRCRRQIFKILDHEAKKFRRTFKSLALDKILQALVHFIGNIDVQGFHQIKKKSPLLYLEKMINT